MSKIMTGMPWVGGMGGAAVGDAAAAGIVFGGGGAFIKGMAMAVMPPVAPVVAAPAVLALDPAILSDSDSNLFGEMSDFNC